jgi:putative ABC transport system permease protein
MAGLLFWKKAHGRLVQGIYLLLSYADTRLVWIWSTRTDRDKAFYSLPDFVETRQSCLTLDGMGAYANWGASLTGLGDAERFQGARVTPNSFSLMGVRAAHGRLISESDGSPASERVVVLSFGLWQRRFGGDSTIIGQKLILNSDSYIVIGVLPPEFAMPATDAELFISLVAETDPLRNDRETNFLRTFGRLRATSGVRRASAELTSIEHRLREEYPEANSKHGDPRVIPFVDEIVGGYRTALWTLFGAVAVVLLISCANLAGLLVTRASGRSREVAIRTALGASRARLIRQFLTESLLLAAAGGILGIALARTGLRVLLALGPADLPRTSEVTLDNRVLLFAIAVSLTSGLIFGLAPAITGARIDIISALRAHSRTSGGAVVRRVLVVSEIALSIVLFVGAGLLLKTFVRTQAISPGFAADRLLLLRLSLPKERYATPNSMRRFYDDLRGRLAAVPGVETIALASALPLSAINNRSEIYISGRKLASPLDVPGAQYRWLSPGYFRAMKIPLIEGREFTEHDTEDVAGVAVVDQAMAAKNWPGRSPIGSHLRMLGRDYEVVGVVGDVKHNSLDDLPTATVYAPFPQVAPASLPFLLNGFSLVVRTGPDPRAVATAVRQGLRNADATVPASSVKTMAEFMSAAVAPRRFNLELMSIFAIAALLLAAMGLYGVISYSVALRRSEIGIRMALGAGRQAIIGMILREGLALACVGIGIGVIVASVLARLSRSMLFQTGSADPVTFIGVSTLFVFVAIVAAYVPARRAVNIDPLTALHSD